MELATFLKHTIEETLFEQSSQVFLFYEQVYPFFLFSRLQSVYKKKMTAISLTLSSQQFELHASSLHTSFLGQSMAVFLKPDSEKTIDSQWISFIQSYKGPHYLFCFIDDESILKKIATQSIISFPEQCSSELIDACLKLVQIEKNIAVTKFIQQLTRYYPKMSVEQLLLFLSYFPVIGGQAGEFFEWLDHLSPRNESLYHLSGSFFAKDTELFLSRWQSITNNYSPQFWITFWAEQCWSAYLYCRLMHEKKTGQAQQVSFRLPFSFRNNDWKKYKYDQLVAVHKKIYEVDFALKNGATMQLLETTLLQFMAL